MPILHAISFFFLLYSRSQIQSFRVKALRPFKIFETRSLANIKSVLGINIYLVHWRSSKWHRRDRGRNSRSRWWSINFFSPRNDNKHLEEIELSGDNLNIRIKIFNIQIPQGKWYSPMSISSLSLLSPSIIWLEMDWTIQFIEKIDNNRKLRNENLWIYHQKNDHLCR